MEIASIALLKIQKTYYFLYSYQMDISQNPK